MSLRNGPFALAALLAVAALLLGLGINAPTGLTGKDEYLLGLRIPLEMMQDNRWWIPFIDGEPRLKKPPFLYWLGRGSFELFGPSLVAARAVTVAFALMLLAGTAWLGQRLTGNWRTGLLAAAVLLGMSGIASESRRFMLDVPVAALSLAAFCTYRAWLDKPRAPLLIATAALLAAALLTKGPIALIVCGSGVLALWLTDTDRLRALPRQWLPHFILLVLMLVLPIFWYFNVRDLYGTQLAKAAADELEARSIGLSADTLTGIITLGVPWVFVGLHALWRHRHNPTMRFLALWLLCSLLPFFFIRTFERYLIGSLPPLALIVAFALEQGSIPPWTRRLGTLLPVLAAGMLTLLLWRWYPGQWLAWGSLSVAIVVFVAIWWRRYVSSAWLAASAAALWAVGWGIAFPQLGVNAIPAAVVALALDRPVILFAGPQPALLAILEQKPLRQTSRIDEPVAPGTLITVRAEDRNMLDTQLQAQRLTVVERLNYRALISSGSGIRFAREGATRDDWRQAWDQRDPTPLQSSVHVLEVLP